MGTAGTPFGHPVSCKTGSTHAAAVVAAALRYAFRSRRRLRV